MFPFIKPTADDTRVLCEVCKTEFGVKFGGLDDVKRHVEGPRHVKKAEDAAFLAKTAEANSLLTGFSRKFSEMSLKFDFPFVKCP